ncbi:ABC transporter permease [Paenibacillus aceti]|uniref:Peptide ABC transporter permease n=1 Tax=Paenibacillus aceti TaxID=1820010 RepID=A0ABQ1VZ28_9BACL|nr:FtsX-like permease family protein [Paenibacillus aceti]GGG03516.1 peptide ABC transporter permease [Paenibacillus aceti]
MYAIYSLCRANLRKKKVHNALIGLLILLSTILLVTSVTVILNTTNLFTSMHAKTHGSHELLILDGEVHDPKLVYGWWKEQEGVDTSPLIPFRTLSGISRPGNEPTAGLSNLYLYMMDSTARPYEVDELLFAQGEESLVPEPGTVWLPSSIAYLYDISPGDTLEFSTGDSKLTMEVAAVVVDMPFGAPFPTSARIWMNHQDYITQFQDIPGKDQYMMGLRFENYSEGLGYWERWQQDMGTPYLGSKITFQEMSSFYLIMNKAIGFIMVFLGLMMMFVALFTIGFTISDDILSNYKTIGVIKALGLTSRKLTSVYMMQYITIAAVAVIPGFIASRFLAGVIVDSALSSLKTKTGGVTPGGGWPALATTLLVLALILLCVFYYANKARHVQPMQAIRYGMSETQHSMKTRRLTRGKGSSPTGLFGRAPLLAVIGFRNLLKNRKATVLMLLLSMMMSAVLVLGFVLLYSISHIKETSSLWGYDSTDVVVQVTNKSVFSRSEFDQQAASDPRIQNTNWIGAVNGVVTADRPVGVEASYTGPMNFSIIVIDGSYDEIGYRNLSGRNPQNKNEISIGMKVAKQLNKEVGDVVDIYIEGYEHHLTISGIYQSIANMSYSARILVDTVRVNHPDYENLDSGFINLANDADLEQVVQDLSAGYGNSASVTTQQTLLDAVYKQAVASLILPMSIMGLLFTGVTVIIVYSLSRINIRKEGKTYGIYKTLGLTSWKIRFSILLGIMVLSLLGAIIGAGAGVYILPMILGRILKDYGIAELPLILNWWGIVALALMTTLASGLGSWVSSRIVTSTSPRILVIE